MTKIIFCILATCLSIAGTANAFASPTDKIVDRTFERDQSPRRPVIRDTKSHVSQVLRQVPRAAPQPRAHVYLMRGLMNVFSLGMDDLAEKIRGRGIDAVVQNHADADEIVGQIVRAYTAGDHDPIILIGHSLGADVLVTMAATLDQSNIPVALIVLFDGTADHAVPENVTTAVNFTQRFYLTAGAGFHGTLSNVDLSGDAGIDHLTIDKSPSLQERTLDYVLQAATAPAKPKLPARRR